MTARSSFLLFFFWACTVGLTANGQALHGSIPDFDVSISDLVISQEASPTTYFDQTGRKFAILGNEAGEFEAWAWPLKLFVHFDLSFYIGSSTQPIHGRDIVTRVDVRPEVTTITYVYQSFTAQAHFIVPPNDAGGLVLLDVDSIEPLSVVVSFVPTMQPMWPAGLGGQYARWDDSVHAYVISESSRKNHGFIGSPAGQNMSYTPAHMLGEQPNQFRITIDSPQSVVGRFIPIVLAGGKGDREAVKNTYEKLLDNPQAAFMESFNYAKDLRKNTIQIHTPDKDLNDALEWAKFSYDGLFVDNPDFDSTGMMAGLAQAGMGGRPGFGWFFGGDSYLNSLSLNALGAYSLSKSAITFMAPYQREDGKMPHEITQATDYVDWFGDYPYAFIHADTSPYFILAMHAYFEGSGDWAVIERNWGHLVDAYTWSKQTDLDGDGLMDNEAAGLGALEFGALTGIQTDIYLGAVWIQAVRAMHALARIKGDNRIANETATLIQKAEQSFEKFWDERAGQYVYAFNTSGETVSEITPWSAVGLMFGDGNSERATSTLRRMNHSDLTTDWGVRMLATSSTYYEPLNYNYGAVWPFLTSWVTTAQYKRGLPLQAYSNLMASVGHVSERSLGDVTEVFSGDRHTWPQESVPHQGFCTAATVLPAIQGLFGLGYTTSDHTVAFAPSPPPQWDFYSVDGFALQQERMDVNYTKSQAEDVFNISVYPGPEIKCNGLEYVFSQPTLLFEPSFQPGTRVAAVKVNGKEVEFSMEHHGDVNRLKTSFTLPSENTLIEVVVDRSLEIVPPIWNSTVGSQNEGLRIIEYTNNRASATITVEGRSGTTYALDIMGAEQVDSVTGAILVPGDGAQVGSSPESALPESRATLVVEIPSADSDFSFHSIRVTLK